MPVPNKKNNIQYTINIKMNTTIHLPVGFPSVNACPIPGKIKDMIAGMIPLSIFLTSQNFSSFLYLNSFYRIEIHLNIKQLKYTL